MYKVLIDYLNHNGRLRVPGELIDMSESDAAPLIKIGAIEAAAAVPATPPPGSVDQDNPDPETGNADDADPAQPQTGGTDAAQSDAQEQPVVSASANTPAGSDAPKSDRKESKHKAEK